MKSLSEKMRPVSWAIFLAAFTPLFWFVFHPSFSDYLLFIIVDGASLAGIIWLEKTYLVRVFPSLLPYNLDKLESTMNEMTFDKKRSLIELIFRFPSRFSLYCTVSSILKIVPPGALILFFWPREVSFGSQFLRLLAVDCVIASYFLGVVYLESHRFLSMKLDKYQRLSGWDKIFKGSSILESSPTNPLQENIGFAATWISTLLLQWMLVATAPPSAKLLSLALEIGIVGMSGIILNAHLFFLSRSFFLGGLQNFYEKLEKFDPERFSEVLSVHSSPLLARFEIAFNELVEKMGHYRSELARWLFIRSEQTRSEAVGELSSLIVHDLAGPLHVALFCIEEVKRKPDHPDPSYVQQLTNSLGQAVEFVDSLRNYLRGSDSGEGSSSFGEVQASVWQLLEPQCRKGLYSVTFHKSLKPLSIGLPKTELMHILLNIFSNSIKNFSENRSPHPKICVTLTKEEPGEYTTVLVSDNGTGLSPNRFEELTGMNATSSPIIREGLGLRLVRRMVERYGGALTVQEPPSTEGTTFILRLPRATPQVNQREVSTVPVVMKKDEQRCTPRLSFPDLFQNTGVPDRVKYPLPREDGVSGNLE